MESHSNEDIETLKEQLNLTRKKLDRVLDLVQKTFTGNTDAAIELSNIVGVPTPILCSADEDTKKNQEIVVYDEEEKLRSQQTNQKLHNRLEFLDKVLTDHDALMSHTSNRVQNNRSRGALDGGKKSRIKSADRHNLRVQFDQNKYPNPYAWNLNDKVDYEHIYKLDGDHVNTAPAFNTKPILPKSTALVPANNQDLADLKVEQFLFQSPSNKRQNNINKRNSPSNVRPATDFRLDYNKPPQYKSPVTSKQSSRRPQTSSMITYQQTDIHNNQQMIAYPRRQQQKLKQREGSAGKSFRQKKLINYVNNDNENTEQLLKEMEKRFELSTIDLQRRLGIAQDGMVGL